MMANNLKIGIKLLITLGIFDLVILFWKWRSDGVRHAQLCRVHELLMLQIVMSIVSNFIHYRFTMCVLIKNFKFTKK